MSSNAIVQTVLWCAMMGIWYVPVLVAAVAVFRLWRKPVWTGPYCRKCRTDLRGRESLGDTASACPICGADLTRAKHLGRVSYRKSWPAIIVGILVLIGPGIGFAGAYAYFLYVNPQTWQLPHLSNARLIQKAGGKDVQWIVWSELEDRVRKGKLSRQEIKQATEQAIDVFSTSQPPEQYPQHRLSATGTQSTAKHHAGEFIGMAYKQVGLPDKLLKKLIKAYAGPLPRIEKLPRLLPYPYPYERKVRTGVRISPRRSMSNVLNLNMVMLGRVHAVRFAGEPVSVDSNYDYGEVQLINLKVNKPPGKYPIEYEATFAVISPNRRHLFRNKPPSKWPHAKLRWSASCKGTLWELNESDRPVKPVHDPARKPTLGEDLKIERCLLRPQKDQYKFLLKFKVGDSLDIPICFEVYVRFGEREVKRSGRYAAFRHEDMLTSSALPASTTLNEQIDPSIRQVDVVLKPDPEGLYKHSEVTECWGKPIVFENVPLERYDLPETIEP